MQPVKTRPVRRAAPPLKRYTNDILGRIARKTRYVDPLLAENWPGIVGPDLARLCWPGRITGSPRHRTLTVNVQNGAAATRIGMELSSLREKINAHLGPRAIAQIAINQVQQGPHADTEKKPDFATLLQSLREPKDDR